MAKCCQFSAGAGAQSGGFTVSGNVNLEQVVSSAIPAQQITFSFASINHSNVYTFTPTLDSSGNFSIPNVPADNYLLSVKGPIWLRANVAVDTTGGDVSNLSIFLRGGDSNNDDVVDTTDFNILINAFGGTNFDPATGYDPTADFNCDGAVDTTDFNILVGEYANFGTEYAALLVAQVTSDGVKLTWQGSPSSTATGYHLYRSTQSGNYANATLVYSGSSTSFIDSFSNTNPLTKLPNAAVYYIVKAYTLNPGTLPPVIESSASNEAEADGWSPYQINCGGGGSTPFTADAYYTGGSVFSTTATPDTSTVQYPAPTAVYQTARVGTTVGTTTTGFTYTFPNLLPGQFYTVDLYLADFDSTASGQRQFNVAVNGAQVEQNLDIYAIVGTGKALQRQYTVQPDTSGTITVAFTPGASGIPICNGIDVLTTPPTAPTNLQALCTADSKITLFWDVMPGATGYNVYRGIAAGGESNVPINGTTPIPADSMSYSGSATIMYSDTGLTDGTIYYYTVRAIYPAGLSPASLEDSEAPDPDGIPWDTRDSVKITSAIQNAYSNDEPYLPVLHVAGPDGTIYDNRSTGPQPPDDVIIPGTNSFQSPDGDIITLPSDDIYADPNNDFTGFVRSPGDWKAAHGPARRVVSTPGYRGVRGDVYLAQPSVSTLDNFISGDTPDVYLGSHSKSTDGSNEVDAGLTFGVARNLWGVYLRVGGLCYSPNGSIDKKTGKIVERKAAFAHNYNGRFPTNSSVNMGFYQYPLPSSIIGSIPRRVCLINVVSNDNPNYSVAIAAPTKLSQDRSLLNNLVMKRVHAIDQYFPENTESTSNGYHTDSKWQNAMWGEPGTNASGNRGIGQLIDASGTPHQWKNALTYSNNTLPQNQELYLQPGFYVGGFGVPIFGHISINDPMGSYDFTIGAFIPDYSEEYVDIFCQP